MKKDSFSAKSSIYYEDDDFLDHGIQRPYFKDEDYDAFDTKLAESEDQRVIAARKEVVVHRFLPLFEGIGGEEGIASFLRKKGLSLTGMHLREI
ncbi:hypothetical protein RCG23_14295 [Neobacillus sp. PS3-34]|uniref:hypothetical protein n=1 Tax=Neobacillus sp. PS3-34 TaxID=3070678 RepID=UPI0027E0D61B|nr:hypothetical protein [Neobacillus sp. PS3-34]WML46808.1 hypothetical protein RCG23_14295 [Neobacillus sp. PS3-34]